MVRDTVSLHHLVTVHGFAILTVRWVGIHSFQAQEYGTKFELTNHHDRSLDERQRDAPELVLHKSRQIHCITDECAGTKHFKPQHFSLRSTQKHPFFFICTHQFCNTRASLWCFQQFLLNFLFATARNTKSFEKKTSMLTARHIQRNGPRVGDLFRVSFEQKQHAWSFLWKTKQKFTISPVLSIPGKTFWQLSLVSWAINVGNVNAWFFSPEARNAFYLVLEKCVERERERNDEEKEDREELEEGQEDVCEHHHVDSCEKIKTISVSEHVDFVNFQQENTTRLISKCGAL